MMLDDVIYYLTKIRNEHGNIPALVTTELGMDSCDALELVESPDEIVRDVYGKAVLIW